MNNYLKALLEEAYDVALDCEKYHIAKEIAEIFQKHKDILKQTKALAGTEFSSETMPASLQLMPEYSDPQ